jgi:hypothetical protein
VWHVKKTPAKGAGSPDWQKLIVAAQGDLGPYERSLLRRLTEARGRRVPMSELAAALGLPPEPCLDQDFPGLSKFVAANSKDGIEMPVEQGGEKTNAWYWIERREALAIEAGLQEIETPGGTAPSLPTSEPLASGATGGESG